MKEHAVGQAQTRSQTHAKTVTKDASSHRGGGAGGAADETAASVASSSHLLLSLLLFSLSHTHKAVMKLLLFCSQ